jgi:hypothetical protein
VVPRPESGAQQIARKLRSFGCTVAFVASSALAGEPPTFDIHFVILTKNASAQQIATISQLRREVDILNEFFVTAARQPLVNFRFKSATLYTEVQGADCQLARLGDLQSPLNTERVVDLFNACADSRARDPHAINFYVYDAYAPGAGFADATGHGRRNANRPFVFVDWRRLNHGDQAPE